MTRLNNGEKKRIDAGREWLFSQCTESASRLKKRMVASRRFSGKVGPIIGRHWYRAEEEFSALEAILIVFWIGLIWIMFFN